MLLAILTAIKLFSRKTFDFPESSIERLPQSKIGFPDPFSRIRYLTLSFALLRILKCTRTHNWLTSISEIHSCHF